MQRDDSVWPLRARLVGTFRLTTASAEPIDVPVANGRRLIAFLALHPDRAVRRDQIGDLLWGDRGDLLARANLRTCLAEMKSRGGARLQALLVADRDRVALGAGMLRTDIEDLETQFDREDPVAIASALQAIGRSSLLEDLDLDGSWGDWLVGRRAAFEGRLSARLLSFAQSLMVRQDWRSARNLVDAYLPREESDEGITAVAIAACRRLGDPGGARKRYDALERAMVRDLTVKPGRAARDALLVPLPDVHMPADMDLRQMEGQWLLSTIPRVAIGRFEADGLGAEAAGAIHLLRGEIASNLYRFHDLEVVYDRDDELPAEPGGQGPPPIYLLEGTLRRFDLGLRVTVRLSRSWDRRVMWSERFALGHLPGLSNFDGSVDKIAAAVRPKITRDAAKEINVRDPNDFVGQLLAQGPEAQARSHEEARHAVRILEGRIAADQTESAAFLPLSYLYNTDFDYTRALSSGPAEHARALELARLALSLDPRNVHAYTAVGWCHLRQKRWDAARRHFERAIEINPLDTRRVMEAGFGFLFLGDIDRAAWLIDRCVQLNPEPDEFFHSDLGLIAIARGDYDAAAEHLDLVTGRVVWSGLYEVICAELSERDIEHPLRRFIDQVRPIWPPDRPMTASSVTNWIAGHHPFRDVDFEIRFLMSAARALNRL